MSEADPASPEARPLAWVVGAGGLVGRHAAHEVVLAGHDLFEAPVRWADEDASVSDLAEGMRRFAQRRRGRPWQTLPEGLDRTARDVLDRVVAGGGLDG